MKVFGVSLSAHFCGWLTTDHQMVYPQGCIKSSLVPGVMSYCSFWLNGIVYFSRFLDIYQPILDIKMFLPILKQ